MTFISKMARRVWRWIMPPQVNVIRPLTRLDIMLDLKLCDE